MKKLIIPFVTVCTLLISCVSTPVALIGVQTENTQLSFVSGTSILTSKLGEIEYSLGAGSITGNEGRVLISIKNQGQVNYNFYENTIDIYGGNYMTNTWSYLTTWNSSMFLYSKARQQKNLEFWTAFFTTWAVIDSAASDYPADFVFTAFVSDVINAEVEMNGANYMEYLRRSVLYSNTVRPNDQYAGWVYFRSNNSSYTDFMFVVTNSATGEKRAFIFTKLGLYETGYTYGQI